MVELKQIEGKRGIKFFINNKEIPEVEYRKEQKKQTTAIAAAERKAKTCKHCGYYPIKIRQRVNHPFGTNSKSCRSKWVYCNGCGKEELASQEITGVKRKNVKYKAY